jgi:hypothetical protein
MEKHQSLIKKFESFLSLNFSIERFQIYIKFFEISVSKVANIYYLLDVQFNLLEKRFFHYSKKDIFLNIKNSAEDLKNEKFERI